GGPPPVLGTSHRALLLPTIVCFVALTTPAIATKESKAVADMSCSEFQDLWISPNTDMNSGVWVGMPSAVMPASLTVGGGIAGACSGAGSDEEVCTELQRVAVEMIKRATVGYSPKQLSYEVLAECAKDPSKPWIGAIANVLGQKMMSGEDLHRSEQEEP